MEEEIPEEVNTKTERTPLWLLAAHVFMVTFVIFMGVGIGIQFGVGLGLATFGLCSGIYGFILGRN